MQEIDKLAYKLYPAETIEPRAKNTYVTPMSP